MLGSFLGNNKNKKEKKKIYGHTSSHNAVSRRPLETTYIAELKVLTKGRKKERHYGKKKKKEKKKPKFLCMLYVV